MGKKMPRGIRNNNPGNLDRGSPWQGLVEGNDPRFCTFADPAFGIRALAVTLITYYDKRKANDGSRIDTVKEIIERWAPPHENDTREYTNYVARVLGVAPDTTINLHLYDTLRPLVEAIIRHENGKGPLSTRNTWYSDEVIEEGLHRAGIVRSPVAVVSVPATRETAGATITASIGVAQIAEAAPQVLEALRNSESNLTSGDWCRMAFGALTICVAIFIAWSQVRKFQKGVM